MFNNKKKFRELELKVLRLETINRVKDSEKEIKTYKKLIGKNVTVLDNSYDSFFTGDDTGITKGVLLALEVSNLGYINALFTGFTANKVYNIIENKNI